MAATVGMSSDLRAYAVKVARNASAHAATLNRADLVSELDQAIERLTNPSRRVVICGGFKQGKTSVLNSLLNGRVAPSDATIPTAVPLSVIHGDKAAGVLLADQADRNFRQIELVDLSDVLLGRIDEAGGAKIVGATARFPRQILEEGLVLVDTPPVSGGMASPEAIQVLNEVQKAAAFVFVTDAGQELTAPELEFVRAAHRVCPMMVCCVTKIDLYPEWPRILHISETHLRNVVPNALVLPVSSTVRQRSVANNDADLARASGYPFLSDFLRHRVLGEATRLGLLALADLVRAVVTQLLEPVAAEMAALQQPDELASLRRRAEEAKAQVDVFGGDRGWEKVLRKELQRIRNDSEFNLRIQLNDLEAWANDRISSDDPAAFWSDFEGRLHRESTQAVVAQLGYIRQAAMQAIERVAEAVQRDAADFGIELEDFRVPFSASALELDYDVFKGGLRGVQTGMVAARFGGAAGLATLGTVKAVGAATSFAAANALSFGLAAPVAVITGLVFTRVGRQGGIERRQLEARQAVAKYLRDLRLVVEKASSDAVIETQEQLIESFDGLIKGLSDSYGRELEALKEAERRSQEERPARIAQLQEIGERLQLIYQHAQRVTEAAAA